MGLFAVNKDSCRDNAANAWLARLNATDVSERDVAAFQQWLAEDTRNQRAFLQAEQCWQASASLHQPSTARTNGRSTWAAWPSAAIVALLLLVVTLFTINDDPVGPTHWQANTLIGEQKRLELSDGTSIFLNTDSQIEVDYFPGKRRAFLHKGEAFFTVAKNSEAPFEVNTPSGIVRVLGTQFSINLAGTEPSVTVLEGRVAILETAPSNETTSNIRIELQANQKANIKAKQSKVESVDAELLLSWRNKVLTYRDAPIEEIIDDLNRYTTRPILLKVPSHQLEDWPKTSAVIQLKDEKTTIRSLAMAVGLELEVDDAGNRYILHSPD